MLRKLLTTVAISSAIAAWAVNPLPRSTPEAEGVPSGAIHAVIDSLMAFDHTDLHTLVVMRHGKVIAEAYAAPFTAASSQQLYSCSKTFTALAVGLAIADNRLRLDDRMGAIFAEQLPAEVSDSLAAVTVADLLKMQSGVKVDWGMRSRRDDWVAGFMQLPMVDEPGKRFAYDSMSSYMLAAIVQRVTGRTVMDLLQERIFTPLGITDARWEVSPEGVNTGGWGLWMLPESLGRFGQMMVQKGNWEGQQLVPAEWVEAMTTLHVDVDQPNLDDYGYQTWICRWPGASRADGAMGQFVFMIEPEDMVIVITQSLTGAKSGPREQSWLWDGLMPAVVASSDPLPADAKALTALQQRIASLTLPLPKGDKKSPLADRIVGRRYELGSNSMGWKSLRLDRTATGAMSLTVTDADGHSSAVPLGYREWLEDTIAFNPANSLGVVRGSMAGLEDVTFTAAGAYAWPDKKHLTARIYFTNWGSSVNLEFDLTNAEVPQLTATCNWAPDAHKAVTMTLKAD